MVFALAPRVSDVSDEEEKKNKKNPFLFHCHFSIHTKEKEKKMCDVGAFRCSYSGCAYDCQRRAPMRVPCACARLVCRKCASIVGSGPDGCALCGATGVSYSGAECKVDMGILLALSFGTFDGGVV